jgi:hypothetical protein
MVFLFSLINVSFTLFFFLFWQYIESVLFWILSVVYILYFSKILSFLIGPKSAEPRHNDGKWNIKKIWINDLVKYFKKWSYYIAFSFFYISLYGIIYSINLIYKFSSFSIIFQYLTFFISLVITGIFFIFLRKKHETISLIFRSNCIIYVVIYSILLLFFLWKNISISIFFIINSLFPIVAILCILIFDSFFIEKNKYVYSIFLFYLFLISIFYSCTILTYESKWHIILSVLSFFMIIYTFVLPTFSYFKQYKNISQNIGIFIGNFVPFLIMSSILLNSLTFFYVSLMSIYVIYNYIIYKNFRNHISYAIFLLILVFLYVKIFLLFWSITFISFVLFIFILPFIFIGWGNLIHVKEYKDLYVLHFIGITFSIISLGYYFIQIGSIYDILSVSSILFLESILLFISYIWLKK